MEKSGKALVVGAGIAGASVAYFLARHGVQVTVLDAGEHTASHVPSALINPVRGQSGQVAPEALAGMAFTWNLLAELGAQGYAVPHAKSGVWRPIPDQKTAQKFQRNLPSDLAHDWLEPAPPLGAGWHTVLQLSQAGLVSGPGFCEALLQASGATRLTGVWKPREWLEYAPSETFICGGSYGADLLPGNRAHRMGSLLLLDKLPLSVPLSFGAYLAPHKNPNGQAGGVLGSTFEAPSPVWQPPHLPLASLGWLWKKGAALHDLRGLQVTGHWTGTRLSGLQSGPQAGGYWQLSGLGSKGFLLGPLLAHRLVMDALNPAF